MKHFKAPNICKSHVLLKLTTRTLVIPILIKLKVRGTDIHGSFNYV